MQISKFISRILFQAVYNDFACTTEFVKKAIEKRNDWEAYHVSEKKYEYGILEKGQY